MVFTFQAKDEAWREKKAILFQDPHLSMIHRICAISTTTKTKSQKTIQQQKTCPKLTETQCLILPRRLLMSCTPKSDRRRGNPYWRWKASSTWSRGSDRPGLSRSRPVICSASTMRISGTVSFIMRSSSSSSTWKRRVAHSEQKPACLLQYRHSKTDKNVTSLKKQNWTSLSKVVAVT